MESPTWKFRPKGVSPMKSMRIIVPAVLAAWLLVVPPARGQGGNVEEQIKTLSDQLSQATVKGDTSFFEKYLADDYVGIYASSQVLTKAETLRPVLSSTNPLTCTR